MTSDKLSLQLSVSSSGSSSRYGESVLVSHVLSRVLSPSSLDEGEEESSPNGCPPLATPPLSPRKLAPTSQRRKRRTVYTAGKV